MLEKPDLQDGKIVACLQAEYGMAVAAVTFLPLGADRNTAVYRATTGDAAAYFVKLRRADFDEIAVTLPKLLSDQGIAQIICPLTTISGRLWASLESSKVIVYPFIQGRNGYEVALTDRHWADLGMALKRIHTLALPPALIGRIPRETYTPRWREAVKAFVEHGGRAFGDPVAVEVAALLEAKRGEILDLVGRAEHLALVLTARSADFVLCHSDVHAGNVLIGADGAIYIVDWDNPILAPKERDLMFIGGGQGFVGHTAQEEETAFYRGYGQTAIDPAALAYYRYERIVQDIAIFCEQLLLSDAGGDDRQQSLGYLKSNFLPNGTIEAAYRSDRTTSKD